MLEIHSEGEVEVHFKAANGLTIAGKSWGRPAPPHESKARGFLALHGWLDNANTWDLVVPTLVQRFDLHVICVDLPGHGRSQAFPQGQLYYPWELTSCILDVVETLGWKHFSILGHSRGAHLAFLFAGTFPHRVHRLLAIESVCFTHTHMGTDDADHLARFLLKRRQMHLAHHAWQRDPAAAAAATGTYQGKSLFATVDDAARARMAGENPLSFAAARRLCGRGVVRVRVAAAVAAAAVAARRARQGDAGPSDPATSPGADAASSDAAEWQDMYTWSTDKQLMQRTFVRWDDAAITRIVGGSRARVLLIFGRESTLWGVGTKGRASAIFRERVAALQARPREEVQMPVAAASTTLPAFSMVDLPGNHHLHLEEETAGGVLECLEAWLAAELAVE
ncbi:hypothetical protein HDU96_006564 [Phlyctochytrium bullatum]|nr:hypothetical protein HDU96_006564 [Phlyctochytrium bullatum]